MGADAPIMTARWEEGKKSMVRVGCILDNAFHPAQAAFMVNVLSGGQLGAIDPTGGYYHPLECFAV